MTEPARQRIRMAYLEDEATAIRRLLALLDLDAAARQRISAAGADLVRRVRNHHAPGVMQSFLVEYGLSTHEGVALMCLAEALLRVPDAETIDALIQDKIVPHDWASHIGDSGSILVNASTWALLLTGRMLEEEAEGVVGALHGVLRRLGEPVVRRAVEAAMREMGEQFVLGQDIDEAQARGAPMEEEGYTYSYDMLGEAARTETDARRYHAAYLAAIRAIGARARSGDLRDNPGISVKLTALHPRYEFVQANRMLPLMCDRVLELCRSARQARVGLNIDAEEADRLEVSLDVVERVLPDPSLAGWDGFGVVVQAYGQRAVPVLDWLYGLASRHGRRIMVRLVKGAYWDTEIKRAQVNGLPGFPVFTRKAATDVSYLACARRLLGMRDLVYPQFATHNAHTMAAVLHLAGEDREGFEFQRLHGMGEALHEIVREQAGTRCRVYAPVGTHEDLLAYLVRRLLENGANSSFVNQIVDTAISPETIARDPVAAIGALDAMANPKIPPPLDLYAPGRLNSRGYDVNHPDICGELLAARDPWLAGFCWDFAPGAGDAVAVGNPAVPAETVGRVVPCNPGELSAVVARAVAAFPGWSGLPAADRARRLLRAADLYEEHSGEWLALLAREAGKTLVDSIAEIREAVDFLRYYATGAPQTERDTAARGAIVCISPWNFPLAIFTGQVAAALVTGNTVLAKPAEQTPLIAGRAVGLLHQAGIPADVLQLVIGDGETAGAALTARAEIAGVCFTGSTDVAAVINRQLARTAAPDAMLIAETGGINVMIVDSTALLEQAVADIVEGAFRSAGQRCSALRVLYVQSSIRDRLLEMLFGAMEALSVGDPLALSTDVGPVIDGESAARILAYRERCRAEGRLLFELEVPPAGHFVPPMVVAVGGVGEVAEEIFGPVLHVASFEAPEIPRVVDAVNAAGFGLTFGLHTRIDRRAQEVINHVRVGNIYVNRNQIGAVVGSQPFGGEGLSGTGPKAGGPYYLRRFRRRDDPPAGASGSPVGQVPQGALDRAAGELGQLSGGDGGDRTATLRKLLRGRAPGAMAAAAAMDCGPVDLPGPTGESNRIARHPLGLVVCLSHDPDALLDRTVQALRPGNRVLALGAGAQAALAPLLGQGLPLAVLDGAIHPDRLADLNPDAVSADGTQDLAAIRRRLAARDGPIVRLITERIYPEAYVLERSICIDTTAAGGNAALLAASETEDAGTHPDDRVGHP